MNFIDTFEKYNLELFKNGVRLPEIKITDAQKEEAGLKSDATNEEYLKKRAWLGCLELIEKGKIKQSKEKCIERLKTEFEVFKATGSIDYILLLMDILLWCDANNIARGVARGSAAGSLALAALKLININALDHDLNFTRFLNEARSKPHYINGILHVDGKSSADFDADISFQRRPELIREIERKYPGKTCKILTVQYLTGKTALKDTVKSYLEYDETTALELTTKVESLYGKVASLTASLEGEKDKNGKTKFEIVKEVVEFEKNNKKAFAIARQLENLYRGAGQHASGMALSYYPLDDTVPMELAATNEVVSGFDMEIILTLVLKVDILGLRTVDVIQDTATLVGLNYKDIDVHSEEIYRYLSSTDSYYGLFQIEDGLTKEVVKRIQPKNIDQLAACLSISRPGALSGIGDFEKFSKTGEIRELHPDFDKILAPTGGQILYQETINTICQNIYKMSPTDADDVRRCIGKKDTDGIKKWEPIIFKKGEENGIPKEVTEKFWATVNASADYLFNANHCYSYAYITAYTTYLKAKYPKEFFLSCLRMAKHEADSVQCYQRIQFELAQFNIKLLPPSLTKSQSDFSIEGNDIRCGLSGVKGLSDAALEKLRMFSKDNATKLSLMESFVSASLPMSIIQPLILAGTLDDDITSRSKLLVEMELYKLITAREKSLVHSVGAKYGYDLFKIVKAMAEELKDEKGKPYIAEKRMNTIRRDIQPAWLHYKENAKLEDLSNWFFERELIGYSYSQSLHKIFSKKINNLLEIKDVMPLKPKELCKFVGIVEEIEKRTSRGEKKSPYYIVTLRDDSGPIRAFIWGERNIESFIEENGRIPKENDIMVIHASKKHEDSVYINQGIIQDFQLIMKKSQVRKKDTAQQKAQTL